MALAELQGAPISHARPLVEPTAPPELPLRRTTMLGLCVGGALVVGGVAAGQPLLALAGAGLVVGLVALQRIELLVLLALLGRSSLDALKGIGPLDPGVFLGGLFLVVAAVVVAIHLRSGKPHVPTPVLWPMVAFVLTGIASVWPSASRGATLIEVARISAVLAMIIILQRVLVSQSARIRVLIVLLGSATVPVLTALAQRGTGSGRIIGDYQRSFGTFTHPNPLSIYLVLMILGAVALLWQVSTPLRVLLVIYCLLATAALYLTYTRGSWIGLAIGLVVIGVLQSRGLLLALMLSAIAIPLGFPEVLQRFSDIGSGTSFYGRASDSVTWRLDYWVEALHLADGSPILGIGLGGVSEDLAGKPPHNDVIRAYVETGIVGLVAYLVLLISIGLLARRALLATTRIRGVDRGIAVGFAAMSTSMLAMALSSNLLSQVVMLWYFFAFAGLAAAVAWSRRDNGGREINGNHGIPA